MRRDDAMSNRDYTDTLHMILISTRDDRMIPHDRRLNSALSNNRIATMKSSLRLELSLALSS